VSDNAKDWLDKVADKYNLMTDEIVAESWRGGGMRHKNSPYDYTRNTFTGKVKDVAGSDTKPEKERSNLNNIIGLHPSNGSWANFLKDAELREEKNGIKHYISSNGHYIVLPDGEVITFYGHHGQVAFDDIVRDKDKWLKEREKAEKEMEELLHPEIQDIAKDMGLTDTQIAQAKEEGVTTIAGLRRIEKNSRGDIRAKLKVGDDSMSWGITAIRAVELGEDPEYPRSDAAIFHFDKLTPEEQQNVIRLKNLELEDAKQEQKNINAASRESAKISRELHLRPGEMSPYPYKKKQAKERIANIESSIARLTLQSSGYVAVPTSKSGDTKFDIYKDGVKQSVGAAKKSDIEPTIAMLKEDDDSTASVKETMDSDFNQFAENLKKKTETTKTKEPSWSDRVYHEMGSPTLEKPYHLGKYEIVSWANHPRGILVDVIDDSKVGLHTKRLPLDELIAETEPKNEDTDVPDISDSENAAIHAWYDANPGKDNTRVTLHKGNKGKRRHSYKPDNPTTMKSIR
jgi:hypothetical protein